MGNLRRFRAGQSSVEYFTTYAWVIIVALIGVYVLWQMGAFKPPVPKRGFLGFSQIIPVDWALSASTNQFHIQLRNEAGDLLTIIAVGVTTNVSWSGTVDCSPGPPAPVAMNPGKEDLVTLNCTGPPSVSDLYEVGDYYEADVVVEYVNEVEVDGRTVYQMHKSVGKLFGPVESAKAIPLNTTTTTLVGDCGLPCFQARMIGLECHQTCEYCYDFLFFCRLRGDCGGPCESSNDCKQTCLYCNTSIMEGPKCEQGDCGKPCSGDEECDYGCDWCNPITSRCDDPGDSCGDPCNYTTAQLACTKNCKDCDNWNEQCSDLGCRDCFFSDEECPDDCGYCNVTVQHCQQGDCGKPCVADDECEVGCDWCENSVCVKEHVTTSVSMTSTSSTSTLPDNGSRYLHVRQVYPKNGAGFGPGEPMP